MRLNMKTLHSEVLPCTLLQKRENHTCQVLEEDKIVVVGGWNGREALASPEILEFKDGNLTNVTEKFKIEKNDLLRRNRPTSIAF